jgi:hypothetical protein
MFSVSVWYWRQTMTAEKCANPPLTRERVPSNQRASLMVLIRRLPSWSIIAAVVSAAWWWPFTGTPACSGAEPQADAVPFTRVLDTQTRSTKPYAGAVAARLAAWAPLAEDDLRHTFRGDAALVNDRLTLVLRIGAATVEVYGREAVRNEPCVEVAPVAFRSAAASRLTSFRIVENTPSTVAVEADFELSAGAAGTLQLRLTTGQPIVEVRVMKNVEEVAVVNHPRFLVVPRFFGNDDVFEGRAAGMAFLPTDNMLLQLSTEDVMVMPLWSGNAPRSARPLPEQAATAQAWRGCAIPCPADQPLWIAVLQGQHLWHAAPLAEVTASQDQTLAWQPPFDAKWRADLPQPDGYSTSWYFGDAETASALTAGQAADCPCRIEGGRAVLRIGPELLPRKTSGAATRTLLMFPMDRSRTTPLTVMLPVDAMRNTLGVGPCQYLLGSEGLASESDPTPAAVMDEIERLFRRRRDKQSADEIGQRLENMTSHLAHMETRIEQYRTAGPKLLKLLEASATDAGDAAVRSSLQRELDRLDQILKRDSRAPAASAEAARLAQSIRALVGQPNSADEVQKIGVTLRALGAQQDRTLATARQLLRRLQVIGQSSTDRWAGLQNELQTLLAPPSPEKH